MPLVPAVCSVRCVLSLLMMPGRPPISGASSILKLARSLARRVITSILARDWPTQLRGPSLNGMKVMPRLPAGAITGGWSGIHRGRDTIRDEDTDDAVNTEREGTSREHCCYSHKCQRWQLLLWQPNIRAKLADAAWMAACSQSATACKSCNTTMPMHDAPQASTVQDNTQGCLLWTAIPCAPPVVLVVLSYTQASTGTSSQRSGLYCAGASQLWMVLWMANSGVAAQHNRQCQHTSQRDTASKHAGAQTMYFLLNTMYFWASAAQTQKGVRLHGCVLACFTVCALAVTHPRSCRRAPCTCQSASPWWSSCSNIHKHGIALCRAQ